MSNFKSELASLIEEIQKKAKERIDLSSEDLKTILLYALLKEENDGRI